MARCPASTGAGRCGAVWAGGWSDRRGSMARNRHGPREAAGPTLRPMDPTASSRPDGQTASPLTGTLLGAALAVTGVTLAVLTIQTPFVARAMPGGAAGSSSSAALLVWALAIAAGGSLLVSGAGRLAVAVDGHAIGRRPALTARPRPRRPAGRRHRRRRQPQPRRTARFPAGRRVVRGRGPPRDGPAHGDPPGRVRRGKPGRRTGGRPPSHRWTGRRATPIASVTSSARPTSTSSHGSTRRS